MAALSAQTHLYAPLSFPVVARRIVSAFDLTTMANMERACSQTRKIVVNYLESQSELSVGFCCVDGSVVVRLQSTAVNPESIGLLLSWLSRRTPSIFSLKLDYFSDCPSLGLDVAPESQKLLRDVLIAIKGPFRQLQNVSISACSFVPLLDMNVWMALPYLQHVQLGGVPVAGSRIADELNDGESQCALVKLLHELVGSCHALRSVGVFQFVSVDASLSDALECGSKLTSLSLCRVVSPRSLDSFASFSRITHLQLHSARLAYSEHDIRFLENLASLFPRLAHCELIEPWMSLVPLAVRSFLKYKHVTARMRRPANLVLLLTKASLGCWSSQLIPALKMLFDHRYRSFVVAEVGNHRVVAQLRSAAVIVYAGS